MDAAVSVDGRPRPAGTAWRWLWSAAAAALALGVFAVDTLTGYESAVAVLYALVIVIGAAGRSQRVVLGLAAGCVVLATASFLLTHLSDMDASSAGRLAVALFAMAMTAALLSRELTLQRTRAALEESEANLRAVADSVPQILWRALPDGRLTYLNRRWTEMTGASVADGLAGDGRAWISWVHPDDQAALLADWAAANATATPLETYRRLTVAGGGTRWLQISARPIRDDAGHVVRWYGVSSDIDAEMQAQLTVRDLNRTLEERVAERTAALARSEARYRTSFEQSHVAMLEEDVSGLLAAFTGLRAAGDDLAVHLADPERLARCLSLMVPVDANDAAARLLGAASRADVVANGRSVMRPGAESTAGFLAQLFAGAQRMDGVAELVGLDGRAVRALCGASIVAGPEGRTHLLVGMIDVTERERSQEMLLQAQADLARANRTATVGAFSATLAHELNQPIGALMMDAQTAARWLDRDPPDLASARRALARLAGNAERASAILKRTREQLTRGRRRLEPLDLGEVATAAVALVERELRQNGVAVTLDLAPTPAVDADRIELQQVMLNLLVNAVQAMADAPVSHRVVAVAVAPEGEGSVAVTVRDRGTGIPDEALGRIFDPFFTTKSEGMGMGLQICRSIIQAFGGDLGAANNDDGGATFRFVLPVAAEVTA